jgi:hypothetical protein
MFQHIVTVVTSLTAIGLLAGADAHAQPAIVIPHVSRAPTLQDFLDHRPREAEAVVREFVQREPGDGTAVSQTTTAYLSYDREHLYAVFVCEDARGARTQLARREAIAADDQVALLIDTFHDRRRAYRFAANPIGVQADALVTEGQPEDFSYDALWHSSGRITSSGFVVWIAIPFRSLRLPPATEQRWGIALVRSIPRNSEESYWPAITRRVEGLVPQFATATGVRGVSGGRNLQLIPYGLVAAALEGPAVLAERRLDRRVGFDGKVVIRDALTLDLAVNPDFSQVESDQPQITTNQRFEVFFPERRPFFVENAGLFLYGAVPAARNVPETLFFSRRIVDPGIGARLTGKIGSWAIAALAADDRAASAAGATRHATLGVARVQREVGSQSAIGVFASSRRLRGRSNQVAAVDSRVKIGSNWVLTGLVAASDTADGLEERRQGVPGDRASHAGLAVNINANRSSRRLLYNAFYSDRSPSFATDLGFVPRTDIRQIEQYIEYRWRPASGPVIGYGPNSYVRFNWDRRGRLQEWIVRFPFQVDLKGRTSVFVRRVESAELFRDLRFRQHLQTVNVTTEWLRWLSVSESFEVGRTVNFFPAAGMAPHPASFVSGTATLSLRPISRLQLDLRYLFNGLDTVRSGPGDPAIFSNHLARVRVNYQATRALSLRAIVDYGDVDADSSRVTLRAERQVAADFLLTYLAHPGTAFHAGYATGRTDSVDGLEPASRLSTRRLFVKANYLLRF